MPSALITRAFTAYMTEEPQRAGYFDNRGCEGRKASTDLATPIKVSPCEDGWRAQLGRCLRGSDTRKSTSRGQENYAATWMSCSIVWPTACAAGGKYICDHSNDMWGNRRQRSDRLRPLPRAEHTNTYTCTNAHAHTLTTPPPPPPLHPTPKPQHLLPPRRCCKQGTSALHPRLTPSPHTLALR